MTEEKERPPPNPPKNKEPTPETPTTSSASKTTAEFSLQKSALAQEEIEDNTPDTPIPSTSLDLNEEQSKPREASLSPFNLTASKHLKHRSPKLRVDVDILINKWDMKSEEIPCLVGENIPSSNSDENYGSYDNTKSSSPARQHLKNHKPWIKAVRGTLHFKDKLDEATMESWLMDGSDDSLPNSNSDYQSNYLNPDDEFEEFQESPHVFTESNTGTNEKIIDLLTGDDYAKEDSNPCTQPICMNQHYTAYKPKEKEKKITQDLLFDSIEKSVEETVEHLLLQTLKLSPTYSQSPPSLSSGKGNQKEAVKEIVFKMTDADHCGNNANCFNSRCVCNRRNIKGIGMKHLDRRITGGFGLDDYNDNLPKCESPPHSNISMDNETKQEDQGDAYFLKYKIESLSVITTQKEGNTGNCENVSTDCPPEAQSEMVEEALGQNPKISEASRAVFREYGETPDKSEALSKHKKRVTFADELEKENQDSESVMITGCGEVQGTQQESMASALPLSNEVNPGREVTIGLPLVREVNPSGDDENNINSLSTAEHIPMARPENPRTEFVPSEANNEDLVSKTQRRSPMMINVQEKIAEEEKVIEKPAGKISRLYKSMKKKIGKIL